MATATAKFAAHATLGAATVDVVNLTNTIIRVEVINRGGVNEVYFTVDGSTPTVGGADTYVVPASPNASLSVAVAAQHTGPPDSSGSQKVIQVSLISSGAMAYSVTGYTA